jgi:hypothetical protein
MQAYALRRHLNLRGDVSHFSGGIRHANRERTVAVSIADNLLKLGRVPRGERLDRVPVLKHKVEAFFFRDAEILTVAATLKVVLLPPWFAHASGASSISQVFARLIFASLSRSPRISPGLADDLIRSAAACSMNQAGTYSDGKPSPSMIS